MEGSFFDVVISGTGLIESVVATAASRCGKMVLHVDRSQSYGRSYGVLDLAEVESEEVKREPLFKLIFGHADGDLYRRALSERRRLSLDLRCSLLLGGGSAVDSLIRGGVSNYLEFRAVEGIFYLEGNSGNLLRVPCSKGDIFNTELLNGQEKRVLTKFLQFAADYGREHDGKDVRTLNEAILAQGRTLYRPQNKDSSTTGFAILEFANVSFRKFMTHFKLSDNLQKVILYALCLAMQSAADTEIENRYELTTATALILLADHINSLGRYGDTALLTPLYGISELPQAFCRMCAVWGGAYMLRTGIASLSAAANATDSTPTNSTDGTGEAVALSPPKGKISVKLSTGETVLTNSVVISAEDQPGIVTVVALRVTRCCLMSKPLLPGEQCLAIIPPESQEVNNRNAVAAMQLGPASMTCPDGLHILHLLTQIDIPQTTVNDHSVCDALLDVNSDNAVSLMNDAVHALTIANPSFDGSIETIFTSIAPLLATDNGIVRVDEVCEGEGKIVVVAEGVEANQICCEKPFAYAAEVFRRLFPNDEFMKDVVAPGAEGAVDQEDLDEMAFLQSTLASANVKAESNEQELADAVARHILIPEEATNECNDEIVSQNQIVNN